MSMALYRRYRPQRFQDVIGQEQVTKPLMAALRANKTAHAYLFSGPRGCGKTTSARILAKCLNCASAPTDTPCGECESCRELSLEGSGSLDVVEMDAASHGGVDDARDLIERASFAPARDRFKIFIIDEAHMVSNQGFNALLKLVEEPPPHIKFIFATTEPEKVIGTIRSRTHHYPFRLVPPETLEHFLEGICADERIDVGAGVLPLVVRSGGGSVRDSLSVLDQLMGGSEGQTLNYRDAVGLLGYTDGSLLDDVVEALAANDGATVFSVVERVVQSGHDPRRFVEDLLQRLRDLIVVALAGEYATDVLASVPRDQYERMIAQSNHLGAARASKCADLVNDALTSMVGATSPRLQLELLVPDCSCPMFPSQLMGRLELAVQLWNGLRARRLLSGVSPSSKRWRTISAGQRRHAPPMLRGSRELRGLRQVTVPEGWKRSPSPAMIRARSKPPAPPGQRVWRVRGERSIQRGRPLRALHRPNLATRRKRSITPGSLCRRTILGHSLFPAPDQLARNRRIGSWRVKMRMRKMLAFAEPILGRSGAGGLLLRRTETSRQGCPSGVRLSRSRRSRQAQIPRMQCPQVRTPRSSGNAGAKW